MQACQTQCKNMVELQKKFQVALAKQTNHKRFHVANWKKFQAANWVTKFKVTLTKQNVSQSSKRKTGAKTARVSQNKGISSAANKVPHSATVQNCYKTDWIKMVMKHKNSNAADKRQDSRTQFIWQVKTCQRCFFSHHFLGSPIFQKSKIIKQFKMLKEREEWENLVIGFAVCSFDRL